MNKWTCNNCDNGPCFAETRNERAHGCEYDITPKACVCGYFEDAPWSLVSGGEHTTPETLSRVLDAACDELGNYCPTGIEECSASCSECWRHHLLAQAEQEAAQ